MPAHRPVAWRWAAVITVAVGLCSLLAVPVTRSWQPEGGPTAEAALARWEARPFENYRLAIAQTVSGPGFAFDCTIEQAVMGGKVAQTFINTCLPREGWTAELLFALAELPRVERCAAAAAGGCACVASSSVELRYNRELGYPEEVRRRTMVRVQHFHPDYWLYLLSEGREPGCTWGAGGQTRTLRVRSVTPLP